MKTFVKVVSLGMLFVLLTSSFSFGMEKKEEKREPKYQYFRMMKEDVNDGNPIVDSEQSMHLQPGESLFNRGLPILCQFQHEDRSSWDAYKYYCPLGTCDSYTPKVVLCGRNRSNGNHLVGCYTLGTDRSQLIFSLIDPFQKTEKNRVTLQLQRRANTDIVKLQHYNDIKIRKHVREEAFATLVTGYENNPAMGIPMYTL
jgi:hypothetical protein